MICHSGGAPGADMMWEEEGKKYGVTTIAYSFPNHKSESKNLRILTKEELMEGYEHVLIAAKTLKRYTGRLSPYVKFLLARDWFQVKNSTTIYAVSEFTDDSHKLVNGGTGWAVQMAVDNQKTVYLFDQPTKSWYIREGGIFKFDKVDYIPKLTENFAGIGTRELNDDGENAIRDVYEQSI